MSTGPEADLTGNPLLKVHPGSGQLLRSYMPHALSAFVGFLSLSVEILWVRLVGFAHFSVPQAFAFVLGTYLIGIALGAQLGKRIIVAGTPLWGAAAIFLGIGGAFDLWAPHLYASVYGEPYAHLVLPLILVGVAFWKSVLFPIAHHLGTVTDYEKVGRSVSHVYVCNIVGATLGPIITGFVLLDKISLQMALMLMAWLSLAVAAGCALRLWGFRRAWIALTGPICLFPLVVAPNTLLVSFASPLGVPIRAFLENRHGIIQTYKDEDQGDAIFGGNVYDGRMNLDIGRNSNGLDRILRVLASHPQPKRVLMVGLSGGVWAKLVTGMPSVETIDIIEINPGYLSTLESYSHKDFLQDKRVKVITDDARRWLRLNPANRYDLVIMNTTWHWRAYVTNLLSREFMQQLSAHMEPGSLLAFNGTGSIDAFATAVDVFPHAYRFNNFIYAGKADFRLAIAAPAARERLLSMRFGSEPYINMTNPAVSKTMDIILTTPYRTLKQDATEMRREPRVITDENMITEFRHGRGFLR